MTTTPADPPLVSVVLPVFNAAAYLEKAVQSVLQQSCRAFELLIVDDGSTDGSLDLARALAAQMPERVHVLRHPGGGNRGVGESRNLAAAQARGRYLAFLDADDCWLPEKLARQVAWMEARPGVGLTYTRSRIRRDGRGEGFMPGVEELGDPAPDERKQALVQIILVTVNYIFSSVMVRVDCFREAGGFPEDLPFQSEDRIMVAKVAARHGVQLVPEVLCEYFAHDASYSTGVVSRGTAPVIFFDMQSRVVRWLAHEGGRPDWARDVAGHVLPIYFVAALTCKRDRRLLKNVLANFAAIMRLFPDLLPRFLWASFQHSRLGGLLRARARGAASSR